MHVPSHAVTHGAVRRELRRHEPAARVGTENLFNVPAHAQVVPISVSVRDIHVLDGCGILEDEVKMESGEGNECKDEDHGKEEHKTDVDVFENGRRRRLGLVGESVNLRRVRLCASNALHENEVESVYEDEEKASNRVDQELDEIFAVVKADAVVDPWAVVIHVQHASATGGAVVRSVGFPHVADFAVSAAFVFVAHVESPVGGDAPRVRAHRFEEGAEEEHEAAMESDKEDKAEHRGVRPEERSQ